MCHIITNEQAKKKRVIGDSLKKAQETKMMKQRELRINLSGNLLIVQQKTKTASFTTKGRSHVDKFSESSAARMRKYLRECVSDYRIMCTLTYPHGHGFDGAQCKEHLRRFIQELKRETDRASGGRDIDLSIFWFLEFQSRGSIHFHLLLTHGFDYQWIARTWYRICGTEDERHLRAGTRIEKLRLGRGGVASYAQKYSTKNSQKVLPKEFGWCGRFWGISGVRETVAAAIRLSPEEQGKLQVARQLDRLKAEIKLLLAQKKAKIIKRDYGVSVYVISDESGRERVRWLITCIEIRLAKPARFPLTNYDLEYEKLYGS